MPVSRSALSYYVSSLLHISVLSALAWAWTIVPDRMMRKGEVLTLLVVAPASAEPTPVEIGRPSDAPSTTEQ